MIRKATHQDIKAIYSLLTGEASNGKILRRSRKEIRRVIDSFFVFEDTNKIFGCCSLEVYSQKIAEVRSLVVSVEYRNKGIGSLLIKSCLDEAKKKKIYQVLSVTDKCGLFGGFGFKTQVSEKQIMFLSINSKKSL